jgi:hypothetical protein
MWSVVDQASESDHKASEKGGGSAITVDHRDHYG